MATAPRGMCRIGTSVSACSRSWNTCAVLQVSTMNAAPIAVALATSSASTGNGSSSLLPRMNAVRSGTEASLNTT